MGVTGVCWNIRIMALKALDPNGTGYVADQIKCLEYATLMGAKVTNNSYGSRGGFLSHLQAIEAAGEAGALFVAAAGNDNTDNDELFPVFPIFPASYDCDNIIAVLATTSGDGKLSISNYGATSVDLGAPGVDIWSCWPTGSGYYSLHGTSMATPHVAGACALLWAAKPELSHLQAKQILMDTVDWNSSLDPLCVSGGRLNVWRALSYGIPAFSVEDASGEAVATFDILGNLMLKGELTRNTTPTATANDEFRVQDSNGTDVAIINATDGNMFIKKNIGWPTRQWGSGDFFTVRNTNGEIVARIHHLGYMYLRGKLYENADP